MGSGQTFRNIMSIQEKEKSAKLDVYEKKTEKFSFRGNFFFNPILGQGR